MLQNFNDMKINQEHNTFIELTRFFWRFNHEFCDVIYVFYQRIRQLLSFVDCYHQLWTRLGFNWD